MITTNKTSDLRKLGINPGMLDQYADVSVEPTSFEFSSELGWGTEYDAVHTGTSVIMGKQVGINGRRITIDSNKPQKFRDLLKEWRKYQNGDYDC